MFVSITFTITNCRSGALTPNDVAENIIRAMNDSEKQTPKLRAMIDWDEGEIRKVWITS